jgi:hypothetical protein
MSLLSQLEKENTLYLVRRNPYERYAVAIESRRQRHTLAHHHGEPSSRPLPLCGPSSGRRHSCKKKAFDSSYYCRGISRVSGTVAVCRRLAHTVLYIAVVDLKWFCSCRARDHGAHSSFSLRYDITSAFLLALHHLEKPVLPQ